MGIFEKATREKFRFVLEKGNLSVEDLWDLPLLAKKGQPSLDTIAINLNERLKNKENKVSFVSKDVGKDDILETKFEIVKHIIRVKIEEKKANSLRLQNLKKKRAIIKILQNKKQEDLTHKSEEELIAMLSELD